ncbi:helix-turn-helix domain-containing protein [Streptomyces sp. NPDC003233]|uniref:helix-turn-helix domain-containing protein n=1 Tax=Streptomyces sp. NPDC007856 TaxID=3364781 RepID=UPI003683E2B1
MTPNGATIRAFREARGHSLRSLASLTDRHPSTIMRIEEGCRGTTPETLRRIAAALQIPVEAITKEGP